MTINDSQIIRVGWLIDGTGGPIQQDQIVRIEKGLIHSIANMDNTLLTQPGLIDLSDYTLLPALVDAHVHLFMSGSSDAAIRERQLNADYAFIKPIIANHLKQHYGHGVRAVRDGGDYGGYALRYRNEHQTNSHSPVQIKAAGKAWRQGGRYGKLIGRPPDDGHTLAEAIQFQKDQADHVKIVQSGLNSLKRFGRETPPQFTQETLTQAVRAAHQKKLKVMVHCNGEAPVRFAVQAGCDSIEHGFFMGADNLKRIADSDIVWTPTVITMKAYAKGLTPNSTEADMARRNLDHQLEQIAEARRLGVAIAVGTDAGSLGVHHGASLFEELKLLIQAGFNLSEAVRCAAFNGAKLLGLKQPGRIQKGMRAEIITFKGAPTKLTENSNKFGMFGNLEEHFG